MTKLHCLLENCLLLQLPNRKLNNRFTDDAVNKILPDAGSRNERSGRGQFSKASTTYRAPLKCFFSKMESMKEREREAMEVEEQEII